MKIKSKTRRKIEQRTACSLQKRSASSTHGRAFSAQVPDNKALTTLGKPRSVVRPPRRAYSAKYTVKKAPTTIGAPRTVGSQQRRAVSAKRTGSLSLGATCALAGLTLWACLLLQPADSCSASISAVSLKHSSRGTRDGNLTFQLRTQIPKVRFSQITKREYTIITQKSPHSAPNTHRLELLE